MSLIFWRSHAYQNCDFLLGLLQLVYLHSSIWPPLLMLHSHLTRVFKSLILFPPTLYLLSLPPHHPLMLLAVSLYLLLLLPLLIPSGFFNGMIEVSESGALNFHTLFRLIPLTLIVFRNLTLNYLSLFGSLDSLLCYLIAAPPGLVFFLLMSQTLAAASSFSSSRAFPSWSFLPPLFLRLTPTLIM